MAARCGSTVWQHGGQHGGQHGVAVASASVTEYRAGWYPDPLGRYDSRYHNGVTWTADVSLHGERYVDPLGTAAESARAGDGQPNGIARAAMVLGIIGVAIGWIPILFIIGGACAVLALVLGTIGLRRSAVRGSGRSQSIVALTTGACGLAACVVGASLTLLLVDLVDQYDNPNPHTTQLDSCATRGTTTTAAGSIMNLGNDEADFVVRIEFVRAGTNNVQRRAKVAVDNVAAGDTATFSVTRDVAVDEVDCLLGTVTGPLPLGIDLDS